MLQRTSLRTTAAFLCMTPSYLAIPTIPLTGEALSDEDVFLGQVQHGLVDGRLKQRLQARMEVIYGSLEAGREIEWLGGGFYTWGDLNLF